MIVVDLGRGWPKSTTIMNRPKSGRPEAGIAGGRKSAGRRASAQPQTLWLAVPALGRLDLVQPLMS